jgi:hypothetical protein
LHNILLSRLTSYVHEIIGIVNVDFAMVSALIDTGNEVGIQ